MPPPAPTSPRSIVRRRGSPGCKKILNRLSLAAELVCADVEEWTAEPFDAVLLDAPCSSTGTIRRHPDVPWLKHPADIEKLAALQRRLIERAVALTKPGGTTRLLHLLARARGRRGHRCRSARAGAGLRRAPITAAEVFGHDEFITADGDLRTLPCHFPDGDLRLAGLDGFYAARLVKQLAFTRKRRRWPSPHRSVMVDKSAAKAGRPAEGGASGAMARVSLANQAKLRLLASAARHAAAVCRTDYRPSGAALADRAAQGRPAVDRAAGSSHRRRHPRREIYSGRFAFVGKVVVCDDRSIFEMTPPSEEWAASLLGFCWLRHLRAAEFRHHPRQRARTDRRMDHPSGRVACARLAAGGAVAPDHFMAQPSADAAARRRHALLSAIRAEPRAPGALPAPYRRRRASRRLAHAGAIALSYAALCIAGQNRHIKSTTTRLVGEIERQILPDGGHISRDPGAVVEVLLELLPLRQAFAARNIAPPQALLAAAERMMPMLRFFRHSDGTLAHFNGMGPTPAELLLTLLAYDETRGAPLSNAPYSAYQRLEAGNAVLIMDTGRPPPIEMSLDAHAGCLAFEFSSPRQSLIVVNCGMPAMARDEWRQLARATAAHSTVTFNETRRHNLSERRRCDGCSAVHRWWPDRGTYLWRAKSVPTRLGYAPAMTATPPLRLGAPAYADARDRRNAA